MSIQWQALQALDFPKEIVETTAKGVVAVGSGVAAYRLNKRANRDLANSTWQLNYYQDKFKRLEHDALRPYEERVRELETDEIKATEKRIHMLQKEKHIKTAELDAAKEGKTRAGLRSGNIKLAEARAKSAGQFGSKSFKPDPKQFSKAEIEQSSTASAQSLK